MNYLDKNNLESNLNALVVDSDNNQAYVTRDFTADLVEDGIKRGVMTYKYDNIKWEDPYIKRISKEFNEENNLIIIGKLRGSDI